MKRSKFLLEISNAIFDGTDIEDIDNQVQNIVQYFLNEIENVINKVKDKMDITGINSISCLEDVYNLIVDLSEDLY